MTQGMFFSNGKMYLSWEVFLYIIIYILNFIGFHTRSTGTYIITFTSKYNCLHLLFVTNINIT